MQGRFNVSLSVGFLGNATPPSINVSMSFVHVSMFPQLVSNSFWLLPPSPSLLLFRSRHLFCLSISLGLSNCPFQSARLSLSLSFPLPISSVRHSAMRLRSKYVTSPLHLVLNSLSFGVFVFSDVMRRCVLTVRLSWSPLSVHHWIRVNPRRGLLYNSLAGYYIYDLYYDYNPRVRLLNPSELRTRCITVALAFQL